jgi:hypothetical protein
VQSLIARLYGYGLSEWYLPLQRLKTYRIKVFGASAKRAMRRLSAIPARTICWHIKLFLRRLVRCSVGLIEDKITDVTLGNYLSSFKRAIKDHTNHRYSREENQILAAVRIATALYSSVLTPLVH